MKQLKLLCLTIFISTITSFTSYGQTNINKTFIGYWSSDGSTTRHLFFLDKENLLQLVSWDTNKNYQYEEVEILKIKFVNNIIESTEKMVSTNWITYNTYSIIDGNNLKCVIGGDGKNATIYLKRLK
jgi:hypothetical protein